MTRDELNRRRMMFQINAKKNNLLKPEYEVQNPNVLRHSATNDYLEFRKKVAQGAKMQKEAKVNMFNVTEANEQYRQELADKTILVHTGAGGITNAYVAKLDDFYGPGKPRYFYTKEEWEGYQKNKQGASQAGAQRGAKEAFNNKSDNYKNNANAAQNSGADRAAKQKEEASKIETKSYSDKKMEADSKNKSLVEAADNSYQKAYRNSLLNKAQSGKEESIKNSKKNADREKLLEANQSGREASMNGSSTKAFNDAKNKDSANKAQEAFSNTDAANIEYRKNGSIATQNDAKNKELINKAQEAFSNSIKKSDPEYKKELEKAKNIKADKDRWGAYTTKEISSLINDDKRFSNIKTEDDAVNYPGGVEKLYNDIEAALEKKYPEKKKNYEASKNAGADRGAKESKAANDQKADKINKKNWEHNARQNGIVKIEEDGTKWVNSENAGKDRAIKERLNNITDPDDPYLNKLAKDFDDYGWYAKQKQIDLKMKRQDKNGVSYSVETAKKKVKHDSLEDGITTSADLTPEQEYLNFRAKVESGLKHFGQTRGLISVPVNQALKNGESLSHAGTYKYYNKIKLPSGEVRYFYTKEEWDAYNEDYKKNAKEGQAYQKWRLDKGYQYDDEKTATGISARKAKMKNEEKNGASYLTKKEGFIAKSLTPTAKAIGNKIADDISNAKHIPESEKNAIETFAKSTEKEWQNKFEERDDNTRHNLPENYPFKKNFKDIDDIWDGIGKDTEKKLINSYLKDGGIKEASKILKDYKDDVFSQTEEELSKREKSIESFNNMKKSFDKIKTIEDDAENLSNFEKQLLADELGISEWSEEAIAKKYGIDENSVKEPGDDYGASNFDKLAEAYDAFWNDYKAAKKAINSSASKAKEEE